MSFDDLDKMARETPPPTPQSAAAEEAPFTREPEAAPKSQTAPTPAMGAAPAGELTDEQVDRIARRVVQLMSETVVKNIAWEVIPDLAEMVVKERIRQLESE